MVTCCEGKPLHSLTTLSQLQRKQLTEKAAQMAYVPALLVALFLVAADVFFTSIRSTWSTGGDVATYVLLSLHEVVAVTIGVTVFAFFSYTVWFTAGLLGHLTFTIRATFPVWLIRMFFIQMPRIYAKFISRGYSRDWGDPVYGTLVCLDIVSCIALGVCLMYTVCCLSEKRMYAPYHLQWQADDAGREDTVRGAGLAAVDRGQSSRLSWANQSIPSAQRLPTGRGVTFFDSRGFPPPSATYPTTSNSSVLPQVTVQQSPGVASGHSEARTSSNTSSVPGLLATQTPES